MSLESCWNEQKVAWMFEWFLFPILLFPPVSVKLTVIDTSKDFDNFCNATNDRQEIPAVKPLQ